MEAANIGPREADVAPAPAAEPTGGRLAGWTPADPGPLGLAGFAGTTFCLSFINANLVNATAVPVVLVLALTYGGIAQLIAGIWEFRTGNTFGAVAFCSYGAFWLSLYFLFHTFLVLIPASHRASAVGLYLWMWSIFTAYMFLAALRTTGAVALVLLLLLVTFVLLAIGNSALAGGTAATNNTIKLGGWVGIVTAVAAWYTSAAAVVNSTFDRVLLPVFPLHRA